MIGLRFLATASADGGSIGSQTMDVCSEGTDGMLPWQQQTVVCRCCCLRRFATSGLNLGFVYQSERLDADSQVRERTDQIHRIEETDDDGDFQDDIQGRSHAAEQPRFVFLPSMATVCHPRVVTPRRWAAGAPGRR